MNMDITRFLVEGREEQYLRHFFRDFAYDPTAMPESEIQAYVLRMRQPGNLRASLNLYGSIPQSAEQMRRLTAEKLTVPIMAWGGRSSFGSSVIEECGHWVFQERTDFICEEVDRFWAGAG
ncbi:hypothetical protein [Nonomuraea sp. NPDC050643]|uniref:alpha/beta fold hydrolase n=1 Tax=Nonomuraea sp. NPDC050643 TaxID=3155660 RepID=UPI0033C64777